MGNAAERYAEASPRGDVVLVLGPSGEAGGAAEPAGLEALRPLVEGGEAPSAATVVAELTGGKANELYRALTQEG
jgi:hypothetical protein